MNFNDANSPVTLHRYSRQHVQVNALLLLFFTHILIVGWICYAEKTYGQLLIPHLSRVRSPQAIAGALVKNYLAKFHGILLHNSI